MRSLIRFLLPLATLALHAMPASANQCSAQSGATRVSVLELYTSEG